MPSISVIMPVYNVEKYLRECLDSVLAQTMRDFELICVDDGSADASPTILDEYASRDNRVHVFRREHSNAGAVRNFGMTKASGDYLLFLDSDDVFSPWMFESLLKGATENNADIAACSYCRFVDGGRGPIFSKPIGPNWDDSTFKGGDTKSFSRVNTMPWNKIVRRSFVEGNHIRFLEQRATNDFTFEAIAIVLSGKSVVTNEKLIGYRQHGNSIQARKSKDPYAFINAYKAFVSGLKSRNAIGAFDAKQRTAIMALFAGGSGWELSTQTTYKGYQSLHKAIKVEGRVLMGELLQEDVVTTDGLPKRFIQIVRNGRREKLRAFCEAIFAPLLGNASRNATMTNRLACRIRRLINIVFESRRLPWNRF